MIDDVRSLVKKDNEIKKLVGEKKLTNTTMWQTIYVNSIELRVNGFQLFSDTSTQSHQRGLYVVAYDYRGWEWNYPAINYVE